jgi:hypothetical protein
VLGLAALALPQVASAQSQSFGGDYKYVAKFLCGVFNSSETRVSVLPGRYNTIINVLSLKNKTAVAYRSTWMASYYDDCGESDHIDQGVPGDYSQRFDLDRDEGFAIGCYDIKSSLGERCEGFVEGVVTIYSSRPLAVTDVITGQDASDGFGPLSVMEVFDVREVKTSEKITPSVEVISLRRSRLG